MTKELYPLALRSQGPQEYLENTYQIKTLHKKIEILITGHFPLDCICYEFVSRPYLSIKNQKPTNDPKKPKPPHTHIHTQKGNNYKQDFKSCQ